MRRHRRRGGALTMDERFFLPGPTEVRQEVLDAMRHPMIAHRSAAMELLMRTVHARLQPLFGTARPVYVVGGSATNGMEMAVRCGSVQRVLALVCGAFGERFAEVAELTGREVTRVIAEPGEVVSPEQVRLALEHGSYDTVTVVHSETSTGALSDVAGIAAVVREASNAMLLVDAVTSVGAMPVEMDAWGADLVFTGSQKAMALPPGLAFVATSERLLNRARTLGDRGYVLDLVRYDEFWHKAQSPTTPSLPLLFALDRQLADIEIEGLDARFARHAQMARACWDWVEIEDGAELGLQVLAAEGQRSPTVTCVVCDRPLDVVRALNDEGYVIGTGHGALQRTTLRVGHMGDHSVAGLEALLELMGRVMRGLR
ncbi:MAG TPA: alanine--glyoxylate aminotransferase family protein [Gemmatimonadaceae bacterium]|nr:alanine--glyoxylate aminotransferase family protein [Gemmatimonadaceae bacterium]